MIQGVFFGQMRFLVFGALLIVFALSGCSGYSAAGADRSGPAPGTERELHPDKPDLDQLDIGDPEQTGAPTPLTIHLLWVSSRSGGGDAILVADSLVNPARHLLIDAGDGGTAASALAELGVGSLDLMILTHAHHDHYGGMVPVLAAVPVGVFAFNGQVRTAVTYRRLLERVEREVPRVIVVDSVRRITLGDADDATVLTLIPPRARDLATDTDDGRRLNNGSLGVRIDRGSFSFLTTGDAQEEANRYFATAFADLLDVTVLKAGHHGAINAIQPFWLDATSPEVVLVSANGTTHPHPEVLEMIGERQIRLYCTPQHGTITLRVTREGAFAIQTAEPEERRCEPGRAR